MLNRKNLVTLILALIGVAAFAQTDSQPATAFVVQDSGGYNSWPMIQALGGKLVCVYSRGTAHDISQDVRAVYSRTSADGGATWSAETVVADTPGYGESVIAKGLDQDGALLVWVRRIGKEWNHDLYRSSDGVRYERIATLRPSPMPVQITDVFSVPRVGLMALWFAGSYSDDNSHAWGTLTSADNGLTWTQHVVEEGLGKSEWPTEQSAVYMGKGRILAIGRSEAAEADTSRRQFQLTSTDYGKTWKKSATNIGDVLASTPTLLLDKKTGLVSNYYYYRGEGLLKRRTAKAKSIFAHPGQWPAPQTVATGSKSTFDAGNANATSVGNTHYVAYYSGNAQGTAILVVAEPAP